LGLGGAGDSGPVGVIPLHIEFQGLPGLYAQNTIFAGFVVAFTAVVVNWVKKSRGYGL
jgi:hypothetical protein